MPFVARDGKNNSINYEDPTVWFDSKAKKYKLLMHQYDTPETAVGGYAESATDDFFGAWHYDYSVAGYNNTISLEDGSHVQAHRRERPKVFLVDGQAKFLYNGVELDNSASCFTLVQEIIAAAAGTEQEYGAGGGVF